MNPNAALQKHYDEQDFRTWSDSAGLNPHEETFLRRHLFPVARDARILDLGTGGGRFLFALHERGFRRLTGVDLSARMIEAARERSAREGAGIHFAVQDGADLRLPEASFEVVLALQQFLSHFTAPAPRAQALRHIHRVLVPGGLALFTVLNWEGRWFNPWLAAAVAPLKWLKGERHAFDRHCLPLLTVAGKLNVRYAFETRPHFFYFPKEHFEQELADAQLELISLASSRMLDGDSESFTPGGFLYVAARRK